VLFSGTTIKALAFRCMKSSGAGTSPLDNHMALIVG
jgi:hypothetical protein